MLRFIHQIKLRFDFFAVDADLFFSPSCQRDSDDFFAVVSDLFFAALSS